MDVAPMCEQVPNNNVAGEKSLITAVDLSGEKRT